MMSEPVVARGVAEEEFERFISGNGLSVPEKMDAKDRRSFEESKRRIVEAIMSGSVVIDENDGDVVAVFTPAVSKDKTPLVFREPEGHAFMAMDSESPDHNVRKGHAFLASLTQQDKSRFSKLKARDWKVCDALGGLFLGG
jgi:hypothetical protein